MNLSIQLADSDYVLATYTSTAYSLQELGPDLTPSANLSGGQKFDWIDLQASSSGGFTFYWQDPTTDLIWAQDYTSMIGAMGPAYAVSKLSLPPAALQAFPGAAAGSAPGSSTSPGVDILLNDGGTVAIANVQPNGPFDIDKLAADGTPIGTPFTLTAPSGSNFENFLIAPTAETGGYVAAWLEFTRTSDSLHPDETLTVAKFSGAGQLEGEQVVWSGQAGPQGAGAFPYQLVGLADGGFALAYAVGPSFGTSDGDVHVAEYDAQGQLVVDQDLGGQLRIDSLNAFPDGRYAITVGSPTSGIGQTVVFTEAGAALGTADPPPPVLVPDGTVVTAAGDYPAPPGVSTIILTGRGQLVYANNAGDVIWSNDHQNFLNRGTGADVFHLGRGGDQVWTGGGADTVDFAAIPWAGGVIHGFQAGDVLDLTGLMSTTSDTGVDGFADGYLKITDDGSGDAQVWADYHIAGNDGWWLVETLDGVAPASLTHSGDTITVGSSSGGGGGPTDVSTSDAHYVAPANVTSITLTGSQQVIDASATHGVSIISNDSGNALIGGAGADTFHLGRGGDWAQSGAGADTFAYSGTPWAGGGITDFNAAEGDKVDVSGLLAASGYTGSDPFADGYLQLTTDSSGDAQLWSDVHQSGNDGWWLVATLDGVSTSSLHYSGGLII